MGAIGLMIWLGAWQLSVDLGLVNELFGSKPTRIALAAGSLIWTGEIFPYLAATAYTMFTGLLIAIVVGVPFGLITGRIPVLYEMTDTFVSLLYSLPFVLFLPVMILWFGIGDETRILLVVWAAMLPLVINVRAGARNVSRDHTRAAKAFCAPRVSLFVKVVLPATLPFILAGFRLALGRAFVGAIVAEFYLGNNGLGNFVQLHASNFNMTNAMAGIAVLSVIALAMLSGVAGLERRFTHWSLTG